MEPNAKICPFCGEMIKSDALKCRYCREWLNEVQEIKPVTPAAVIKKVEPVIIPVVNEVKTTIPVAVPDAPQAIILEKIPDITPITITPVTKAYSSDTITSQSESKVKTKLKNFYKNRFLPFYQNSHLLFLFLLLIYTLVSTLQMGIDQTFFVEHGTSALVAYNLLHGKFFYANMAVAAITIAAAMFFITVRNDEEKLRRMMHSLLLPIALIALISAGYCYFFTPDHILQNVHKYGVEWVFNNLLPLKTINFILSAASSVLIAMLLARGQFFRLFFVCILTLCLAGVISDGGIIPADYYLHYLIIDSLIALVLLLVFCRKILFKNFRIEFDWLLIGKFLWSALCIFAVSYFCSIFLNTARVWSEAWGKVFIATPIFTWLYVCIWSGKVNGVQNKLGFYLKTLLGCTAVILGLSYLYFNVIYKYNTTIWNSGEEWRGLTIEEMKTWVMVAAGIITVKIVSAAYYCSIKWYFMLPANMFLLLMGCVQVLNFVFPGNNPLGVVIFNRIGLPTEYGWIFLTISLIIDVFALFHVIYTCKKPFELNKYVHATCAVLAALMMLYGFFAIKTVTESELTDIYKEMPLLISQDGKILIEVKNKDIEQVVIPEGVTTIKGCAFAHCNNLTRVVIPDSVTKIAATAFQYCPELKTIEIPKNCIYEPEAPFIQIIRR